MKMNLGIMGRLTIAFVAVATASQLLNYHTDKDFRKLSIQQREIDKIKTVSRVILPQLNREGNRVDLIGKLLLMQDGFLEGMQQKGNERKEAITHFLERIYQDSNIDLIEIVDSAGVALYRAQKFGPAVNLSTVWGVEEALAGKNGMSCIKEPNGALVVSIRPVVVHGEILGAVVVGAHIGESFMQALSQEVGAEVALLTRSGDIAASSSPGHLLPDATALTEAFLQKIPIYRSNEAKHTSLVYLPVLIVDEAWVIMAEIDSSSAFALMEKGDRQSMLFMVLVVGASILITFLVLRFALKPLRDLRLRAVKDVAELTGSASLRCGGDEIFSVVCVLDTLTTLLMKRNRELTEQAARLEREVSRSQEAAAEINQLAFYDTLTNLPNRRLLFLLLEKELAASSRHKRIGALLFIDLDNFKTLNDTLGHDKGDLLLQHTAKRISACIRQDDIVARLGGDEFVVMLRDLGENDMDAANNTETVAEKILATLKHTLRIAHHEYHTTASIGITLFADAPGTTEDLLKQADLAMYQAKAAGRNTIRFFHPEMQARISQRAELENALREGIAKGQFFLCYQVQVSNDSTVLGVEALVRWQHPQHGIVPPAEFIPLAEETGLILPLGRMILELACTQLAAWANWLETAQLTLAVNISARQFQQPDFVDQVMEILGRTGANPQRLKLELTESLVLHNVEDIIAKMTALKTHEIGFSLDDFGTGYSSLTYLKRLPLDQLKIDRSFIHDILTDPNDAAIAKIVIALGDTLGLTVIAEGVESEEQRCCLSNMGCHAYQGYLFSYPLPRREFHEFVNVSCRVSSGVLSIEHSPKVSNVCGQTDIPPFDQFPENPSQ